MLCNLGASVKNDIILRDGKNTTSFGFSLSKSLINVAYLIMDKGVILIGKKKQRLNLIVFFCYETNVITMVESIRDTLKNGTLLNVSFIFTVLLIVLIGKFHMAEILFQSAEDQALSKISAEEGQNIWHILADFKPFDK